MSDYPEKTAESSLVVCERVESRLAAYAPPSTAVVPLSVQVCHLGERRSDFLRRHAFRGLDELRRQQKDESPPKIGSRLDTAV